MWTRQDRNPVADRGKVLTTRGLMLDLAGDFRQVLSAFSTHSVRALEFFGHPGGSEFTSVELPEVAAEKLIPAKILEIKNVRHGRNVPSMRTVGNGSLADLFMCLTRPRGRGVDGDRASRMEVEEGQSSRAGFAGVEAERSLGDQGRGKPILPGKHGRHRRLLRRLGPAVELEILPDILKIRRVNSAVKQFRHLG